MKKRNPLINKMVNCFDEFKGSITVCDSEGVIIYINQYAQNQLGKDLLGTNLLECHPEPARSKVESMLRTPTYNTYTVEKGGKRKIVHQSPNYNDGVFNGITEISFEIPKEMPNIKRD